MKRALLAGPVRRRKCALLAGPGREAQRRFASAHVLPEGARSRAGCRARRSVSSLSGAAGSRAPGGAVRRGAMGKARSAGPRRKAPGAPAVSRGGRARPNPNPFEVKVNRQKFHVLGRKTRHDVGLPGVSRARALQKVSRAPPAAGPLSPARAWPTASAQHGLGSLTAWIRAAPWRAGGPGGGPRAVGRIEPVHPGP